MSPVNGQKGVLTPEQEQAYMLVMECFGSDPLISLHFAKFLIEKKQGLVWEGELPSLRNKGANAKAHVFDTQARAQIILTVQDDGRLLLCGYRMGRWNAGPYANGEDSVLKEIPKLLAELREETAAYYPVTPRKRIAP